VDAEVVPAFRNPVALPDPELALAALQILGADVPDRDNRCNGCHALTRAHLRFWRSLSDTAMADCFTDLGVQSTASAQTMIDCFRAKPSNPSAQFMTPKLGVYASAANLAWFQYVFTRVYGAGNTQHADFLLSAMMPPAPVHGTNPPMTQEEFDIVAEWFIRGLPELDATLPEDPPPSECFPYVDPQVAAHVATQVTEGWRTINQAAGLNMLGCAGASDPTQCLQSFPRAASTTYGATWDVAGFGQNRILHEFAIDYGSSYWTRSSADGRFLGHGSQGPGSTIVDLLDGTEIVVDALYDPAFFPDNSGFVFQGGPRNTCPQSVLQGSPAQVSMTEPGCTNLGQVGLYEHVGGHPGGDYFSVDGQFTSDDGGHFVTKRDPSADFGESSMAGLTPIVWTGSAYQTKPQVSKQVPYEGDSVLSPSAQLLISRLAGPSSSQLGYVLRKVVATPNGPSYTIDVPEIGRYCFSGGKPAFSYDERWFVYQHYVYETDADAQELGFTGVLDPGFAQYRSRGAANIYLVETATGERHRITNMAPGQYALYPHFRSDGWIYYQVRDLRTTAGNDNTEYSAANDAALLLEQQ
jgi:hypothetical protein